jgi:hypothetical protein
LGSVHTVYSKVIENDEAWDINIVENDEAWNPKAEKERSLEPCLNRKLNAWEL